MSRNTLYGFLLIACLAGYTWLGYNILENSHSVGVCLIRETSGIPCPSCGTTRSVVALLHGDLLHAFYLNPLGFLVLLIMLVTPPWIVVDLVLKKDSLFKGYRILETKLTHPGIAVPMALLLVINWVWNIYKDL